MSEELTLNEKLIHIQTKLKAPKNQYNSFSDFYYRSAEDILEAVKPLNAEYGLLLTLNDKPVVVGDRTYIEATATLTDGKDLITVTAYARESEHKKGMDSSQVTGATSSYARKYALNGLYLIDDTKDADTDEYAKQNDQQANKASEKQLNFIDNLLEKNVTEKFDKQTLYEHLKKKMNTDVDMENWTSQQASQAIKILKGDGK